MMVKPSVTELLTKADNRYELVIATSRRARQIVEKRLSKKLAQKNESSYSKHPKEESAVTIAATEIAEGEVEIIKENEEEQK